VKKKIKLVGLLLFLLAVLQAHRPSGYPGKMPGSASRKDQNFMPSGSLVKIRFNTRKILWDPRIASPQKSFQEGSSSCAWRKHFITFQVLADQERRKYQRIVAKSLAKEGRT